MARTTKEKRYDYIEKLYANEDELLAGFREHLPLNKFNIQLSPVEGKILQMLLKMVKAKKVLEVGTLAGYSCIWSARALPSDGEVHTIEKSHENYDLALNNIRNSDIAEKVTAYHGAALDILPTLAKIAPFDAVFIDADKENYPAYLEYSYKYLKPGGLVIADNTFLFDLVLEDTPPQKNASMWESMKRFNSMLADTSKFDAVILPTTEGMSVALKK